MPYPPRHSRYNSEVATRRINLAVPGESLLVTKSTGQVPHTGGSRYAPDSELNKTVMRWLEAEHGDVAHASAELVRGVPFRSVVRDLRTMRQRQLADAPGAQLSFDFQPSRETAPATRSVSADTPSSRSFTSLA